MKTLLLSSLLLLFGAEISHAETYRWTDKQGVIHFTDSPESISRIYRDKATKGADITIRNPEVVEELKAQEVRAREDAARPKIYPTPDVQSPQQPVLRDAPVLAQSGDLPPGRTKSQRIQDNIQRRAVEEAGKPGATGSGY